MRRSAASRNMAFACALLAIGCAAAWSTTRVAAYDAFAVGAVVTLLLGIRRNRPARALPWLLLAGGTAAWVAGNLVGNPASLDGGQAQFGTAADVLYLLGYPPLAGGLILLGRGIDRERMRRILLDTAVIVLALGLVLWVPAFDRVLDHAARTPLERTLAFAYPVADLVLLAAALRLVLSGVRAFAARAILGSFALVLAGDLLHGLGRTGPTVAAVFAWLLGYLLLAAAANHPSVRELGQPRSGSVAAPAGRWAFYATALASLPATFIVQWLVGDPSGDLPLYVAAGLVLTMIVVARLALLFGDVDRARRQAESSERKFRMIFESAPVGIMFGRDGMMTETNPALQTMLGYTGDELARRHFLEITHPDDHDLPEQRALDEGLTDAFAAEKRYVRKDGGVVAARVHVRAGLRGGLGLAIVEDATERRALELQLREAQRLEAVGTLAGGIAHDFNNLMTVVGGHADLLLRDVRDDTGRRRVVAIQDAARRAAHLTRQLLAFGRRQVLEVQELDLRHVLDRAPELLGPRLRGKVQLEICLAPDPVPVRVDPGQLEQVLLCLAANACDAMPRGGVLTLDARVDGGAAVLEVGDTGVGMTPEVREQIFEPFFSTKGLAAASGLGLSTVHGIVHQSGGSIAVASRPGEGSMFTIRLPLALPEPARAATI